MDNLEKKIIISSLILIFIVALISLIIKRKDIASGFLIGGSISLFNFGILKLNIKNFISAKSKLRYIIFLMGYLIRYLIMAVALWIAINRGFGYFWSVAAGLFLVRIAILLNGLKINAGSR